jgi:hypothetical protein
MGTADHRLLPRPQLAYLHSQDLNRKEQHTYNDTLNCAVQLEAGLKISVFVDKA